MSSDTSTTSIAFKKETSFGVLPASPQFALLRFTGESLQHQKETVTSAEIRADRQVSDLVKVGASATGAIQIEFSLAEYRDLILAALGQTAWTDATSTGTADITGNTIVFATPADIDAAFLGQGYCTVSGATNPGNNGIKRILSVNTISGVVTFAAGELVANETGITVTLTRSQANNGTAQNSYTIERAIQLDSGYAYQSFSGMNVSGWNLKVASKEIVTGAFNFIGKIGDYKGRSLTRGAEVAATGTLTLTGNAVADETVTIAGKTYTWKASPTTVANQVKVGATASDSIDNLIAAIMGGTGSGSLYGSATIAHTLVSAAAGSGDTMVITALVEDASGTAGNAYATTETMTNGSFGVATLNGGVDADPYTASTTDDIVNGSNNVTTLAAGATELSDPAKSISFAINNNLRPKDKLGLEGAFEVGQGQFSATGTLETYFESNALFAQIVDHDDISLSFMLTDNAGKAIGITFPRVKLADGNPNTGGINQDVMMSVNFTAIQDPTTGVTMIVDDFAA